MPGACQLYPISIYPRQTRRIKALPDYPRSHTRALDNGYIHYLRSRYLYSRQIPPKAPYPTSYMEIDFNSKVFPACVSTQRAPDCPRRRCRFLTQTFTPAVTTLTSGVLVQWVREACGYMSVCLARVVCDSHVVSTGYRLVPIHHADPYKHHKHMYTHTTHKKGASQCTKSVGINVGGS